MEGESKKKRLRALEEDEYVDGLASVIQRDFFPDLEELRDQQEYVEAERRDDFRKKLEIEMRRRERESRQDSGVASVDEFLGKFTSQDNASFVDLQAEELKRRQDEDDWGKKQAALKEVEREKKLLLLAGPKEAEKVLMIGGSGVEGSQQLMGVGGGSMQLYEGQLVAAGLSSLQRVIDPENTRLSREAQVQLEQMPRRIDPEGRRKKLADLVSRNRLLDPQKTSGITRIDLADFYDDPEDAVAIEAEPTVKGFNFLSTPQVASGNVEQSPQMSWGSVGATPQRLEGREFSVPKVPERDLLAQKLEAKLRRTPATSNDGAKRPPPPAAASSVKTPVIFSPAGQKLLEERLRKSGSGVPSGGSSLSSSSLFFQSPAAKSATPASQARTPGFFVSPVIPPKK